MKGFYKVRSTGQVGRFEGTRQLPGNPPQDVVLLRQENSRLLVAMKSEVYPVRMDRYGGWVKR